MPCIVDILPPSWCTVSAHDSQKRWCPQGTRAIRGSLRLIRHTSQQSSDALVAGSDVTAASCGGVWSVVCASFSSALISHSVGDFQLVLSTFSQAFDHSSIVHSRIVHPCDTVPHCPLMQCPTLPRRADLYTLVNSIPATWCRIVNSCVVHSRKFSVPDRRTHRQTGGRAIAYSALSVYAVEC